MSSFLSISFYYSRLLVSWTILSIAICGVVLLCYTRLITHNLLKCNVKGVENGYPLIIEAEKVEEIEQEYDQDVILKMLNRIQWKTLKSAALNLGLSGKYSNIEELSEENKSDVELLKEIHHLLFEIHVVDGHVVCPESGRRFPVKDSIPNMLLHEDEV